MTETRKTAAAVVGCIVPLVLTIPVCAWSLPGQTGQDMIAVLGRPANDYSEPPQPTLQDYRAGKNKLATVFWPNTHYDPLRLGEAFNGNLVVTFKYPARAGSGGVMPPVRWADLKSYSEVFLSLLSPEEWNYALERLSQRWVLERQEDRQAQGNAYTLYTLSSEDGLLRLQISYSPQRRLSDRKGAAPVFNFWSRIAPADDEEWVRKVFGG